jgi:hypothetical protein
MQPDRHFEKLNDQFCSGHFAIVVFQPRGTSGAHACYRAAPASLDHLVGERDQDGADDLVQAPSTHGHWPNDRDVARC